MHANRAAAGLGLDDPHPPMLAPPLARDGGGLDRWVKGSPPPPMLAPPTARTAGGLTALCKALCPCSRLRRRGTAGGRTVWCRALRLRPYSRLQSLTARDGGGPDRLLQGTSPLPMPVPPTAWDSGGTERLLQGTLPPPMFAPSAEPILRWHLGRLIALRGHGRGGPAAAMAAYGSEPPARLGPRAGLARLGTCRLSRRTTTPGRRRPWWTTDPSPRLR